MEHSASQPQYFSKRPPQPPPSFQHAVIYKEEDDGSMVYKEEGHDLQAYQPPQHQPLQQPLQMPPQQHQRGYFTQEGGVAHHQQPQLSSSQAADLDAIEGLWSEGGQQSQKPMQTDSQTDEEEFRNARAPAGGTFYTQDDGSLVYREEGHEDIPFYKKIKRCLIMCPRLKTDCLL